MAFWKVTINILIERDSDVEVMRDIKELFDAITETEILDWAYHDSGEINEQNPVEVNVDEIANYFPEFGTSWSFGELTKEEIDILCFAINKEGWCGQHPMAVREGFQYFNPDYVIECAVNSLNSEHLNEKGKEIIRSGLKKLGYTEER